MIQEMVLDLDWIYIYFILGLVVIQGLLFFWCMVEVKEGQLDFVSIFKVLGWICYILYLLIYYW